MEVPGPATTPEYRVSARVVAAIRLHPLRAYMIAHRCGLNPSTLSKLLNGIDWVALGDKRVLRLAAFLGIPATEAFDPVRASEKEASGSEPSPRADQSLEDDDAP